MNGLTGRRVGARNRVRELRESIEQARADSLAGALAVLAPRRRPAKPRILKMIQSFDQSGHGWFHGGTAISSNPAASDAEVATHATVVTGTTSTATYSKYNMGTFDATDRNVVALLKVDNMAAINGINLRVSSDSNVTTNFTDLRVSGGNVVNSILNGGEWVAVTFSWADSVTTGTVDRSQLKSFQLRIGSFGGLSTAVRIGWLGIAEARGPYCLISFDDGSASALNALPAMNKHGFIGNMYTIVDVLGAAGFLTLDQLRMLQDHRGWDVCGHAYRLANHNLPNGLRDLSLEELDRELALMKDWLLRNRFKGADHFAWPKGQFTGDMQKVMERYFVSGGMVTNFVAQALPTYTPGRMARLSITSTTTAASINAEVTKAQASKTSIELLFHQIVPSGAVGSIQYNAADFATVMDHIASTGIEVATISRAVYGY